MSETVKEAFDVFALLIGLCIFKALAQFIENVLGTLALGLFGNGDVIAIAGSTHRPAEGVGCAFIAVSTGQVAAAGFLQFIKRGGQFVGQVTQLPGGPLLEPVGAKLIALFQFAGCPVLQAGDIFQAPARGLVQAAKAKLLRLLLALLATAGALAFLVPGAQPLAEPV